MFSSVQWDTALPTPRRAVLRSDGGRASAPSTVPERRPGVQELCVLQGGILAPCWMGKVGQGPRGTPGQTLLGCVWVK